MPGPAARSRGCTPSPLGSEKLTLFLCIAMRLQSDEIQWNDSKKMSVKLIIYNDTTGMYKLKNNKNDEGTVVMRRQTWRADGSHKGTP